MARSIPQATTRPNGFALLRPAPRLQLDSTRILTLSGTIAINLIAMGLLLMPLSVSPPAARVEEEPVMTARTIPREPVVVEIVRVRDPVPTQPSLAQRQPRPAAAAISSNVASIVASETGSEPAVHEVSGENSSPAVESIMPASNVGPATVQLEYERAPAPRYPPNAERMGLSGTVTLQVLVGVDGRPLDVSVVHSSGHRELDEAARIQVMKRWSFRPATRDGLPIQAIGLVPVQFRLRR